MDDSADVFDVTSNASTATTAIHYRAVRPSGRLFVVAHGAGAGQRHPWMVKVARALADRQVDVVTFDFPYMHRRRGAPDKAPVLERCFRDVLDATRQRDALAPSQLFIGGKSMGGRMATHLGAQGVDGLSGIIALGYPLHPPGKPDQRRTAHFPSLTVPLLVIQGERDPFGTPDELRPALAAVPGPVTLHVVSGGDHSLAVRGAARDAVFLDVIDRVAGWIASRA